MARHELYGYNPKMVRDKIEEVYQLAQKIHALEKELILLLKPIDRHRFYTRISFRSFRGFCNVWLGFSRTQSQRLTTLVRRLETTAVTCKKGEKAAPLSLVDKSPEATFKK